MFDHRSGAQVKQFGHLARGFPLGNKLDDFLLPVGKRPNLYVSVILRQRFLRYFVEKETLNLFAEELFPLADSGYTGDQIRHSI